MFQDYTGSPILNVFEEEQMHGEIPNEIKKAFENKQQTQQQQANLSSSNIDSDIRGTFDENEFQLIVDLALDSSQSQNKQKQVESKQNVAPKKQLEEIMIMNEDYEIKIQNHIGQEFQSLDSLFCPYCLKIVQNDSFILIQCSKLNKTYAGHLECCQNLLKNSQTGLHILGRTKIGEIVQLKSIFGLITNDRIKKDRNFILEINIFHPIGKNVIWRLFKKIEQVDILNSLFCFQFNNNSQVIMEPQKFQIPLREFRIHLNIYNLEKEENEKSSISLEAYVDLKPFSEQKFSLVMENKYISANFISNYTKFNDRENFVETYKIKNKEIIEKNLILEIEQIEIKILALQQQKYQNSSLTDSFIQNNQSFTTINQNIDTQKLFKQQYNNNPYENQVPQNNINQQNQLNQLNRKKMMKLPSDPSQEFYLYNNQVQNKSQQQQYQQSGMLNSDTLNDKLQNLQNQQEYQQRFVEPPPGLLQFQNFNNGQQFYKPENDLNIFSKTSLQGSPNLSPESMSPQLQPSSPRTKEELEQQTEYQTLQEIPNVVNFIQTQYGSRIIQKIFTKSSSQELDKFIQDISQNISQLMVDSYGNYIFGALAQHCSAQQRYRILTHIQNSLVVICCDKKGTHAIQSMISLINNVKEEELVTQTLQSQLLELSMDQQGTHIVKKIISRFALDKVIFIFEKLKPHLSQIVYHQSGLCVFKELMSRLRDDDNRTKIILELIESNIDVIVQDPFGNYAVQTALEIYKLNYLHNIINKILEKLIQNSNQKFSSNVVEKCLLQTNQEIKRRFIEKLSQDDVIVELLLNKFGNFVIQKAINSSDTQEFNLIINSIMKNLNYVHVQSFKQKWTEFLNQVRTHHQNHKKF